MIVARGKGGAGNLMFQLGGIESQRNSEREKIVLLNFHKLAEVLPSLSENVTLIEIPELLEKHYRWIDSLLRRLADLRLIGRISQRHKGLPSIQRTSGIIPVTYFWGEFCQSEKVISTALMSKLYFAQLRLLNDDLPQESVASGNKARATRCFVHVRRGDYLSFPSPENSAVLPQAWFLQQMSSLRETFKEVLFTIISDDIPWCRTNFGHLPDAQILDISAQRAFFLMSTSDAGILSPSTFSWWASFFASENSDGPFIAPTYWTGWKMGKWDPHEEIRSSFIKYIDVEISR